MRLMINPSKNDKSFYVIKSVQKNGKNTSEIVEKLGTETFIKETYGVDDAEAWARSHVNELNTAEKAAYELNINAIEEESKYDGFYAVCTNLDDDPAEIARINHDRWEIEESFRIMKSEFDARPVYLHRDDRITAHFLTCFISLMIYSIFHEKCIKAANAVTVCICGDF